MKTDLSREIEQLTGRTVIGFMSDNHIDPDLAVEVFILEPLPAPPHQACAPLAARLADLAALDSPQSRRPRRKDENGQRTALAPIRQRIESIFWTAKGIFGLERQRARALRQLRVRLAPLRSTRRSSSAV